LFSFGFLGVKVWPLAEMVSGFFYTFAPALRLSPPIGDRRPGKPGRLFFVK